MVDPVDVPEEILRLLQPPSKEELLDRSEGSFLRTEVVDSALMGLFAWARLRDLLSKRWPGAPVQEVGKPRLTRTTIVFSGRPRGLSSQDPEILAMFDRKNEVWSAVLTLLIAAGSISWTLWPPGQDDAEDPKDTSAERARLERILGGKKLPELPSLRSSTVRNALVHVEAKSRSWFKRHSDEKADPFEIATWSIGGRSPPPATAYRYLNPKTWELTVNDHTCNLEAMAGELTVIAETLEVQYQLSSS